MITWGTGQHLISRILTPRLSSQLGNCYCECWNLLVTNLRTHFFFNYFDLKLVLYLLGEVSSVVIINITVVVFRVSPCLNVYTVQFWVKFTASKLLALMMVLCNEADMSASSPAQTGWLKSNFPLWFFDNTYLKWFVMVGFIVKVHTLTFVVI